VTLGLPAARAKPAAEVTLALPAPEVKLALPDLPARLR
jgi:hypothetical protein